MNVFEKGTKSTRTVIWAQAMYQKFKYGADLV